MKNQALVFLLMLAAMAACHSASKTNSASVPGGYAEINWQVVNTPKDAWRLEQQQITKLDKSSGYLRSGNRYKRYVLEYEQFWGEGNGGGIIPAAKAIPAMGQAIPEGNIVGSGSKGWTKLRLELKEGVLKIFENNKLRSSETLSENQGYICIAADSTPLKIRKIKLTETVEAMDTANLSIPLQPDFRQLYQSGDLSQWAMKPGHIGHWTPQGWTIYYDGRSSEKDRSLWTKKSFKDFILIADIRLTRTPEMAKTPVILPNGEPALNEDGSPKQVDELYAGDTGIYLRGNSKSQINIGYRYIGSGEIYGYRVDKSLPAEVRAAVTPKIKADNPPGEWNRFIITMKGDRVSIELNGKLVIDNAQLPGIPETGPIALQDDHATNNLFQFANLFIKEL